MSKIKRKFNGEKAGFTLVELLVVMMITVILAASAITGMVRSQGTFLFIGAVQNVDSMVREARSLAVTGKAQKDYMDYDKDGCKVDEAPYFHLGSCSLGQGVSDYVTPANYGIHFDMDTKTMIMFADLHGSDVEGQYDGTPAVIGDFASGKDIKLAEYVLPEKYTFILDPEGVDTVMFTPIFADTSFNAAVTDFFVFGIKEISPGFRKNCSALHRISGVSESTQKTNTQSLCD